MGRTGSAEHEDLAAELVRLVQAMHLATDGRSELALHLRERLSRARAERIRLALAEIGLVVHDIARVYLDQGPPPPRAS